MSKWDDFRKSVSQLTDKAIKKTETLTDTATLKVKIKTIETKINEQYEILGALTYAKLKKDTENTEDISTAVEKIDAYFKEIAPLKLRLAKIEQEAKEAKEAAARAKAEAAKAKAEAAEAECSAEENTATEGESAETAEQVPEKESETEIAE